jgi:hypothetical protein
MTIVSRAQWGARPARGINRGNLSEPSTGHWNGPGIPTVDHSRCAGLVRGIQNFHMDTRGWLDIAYNFLVCPHGVIFEGRGLGVKNGANGTNSGNATSHAIMWMAGQGDPFPETEKLGFRRCVKHVADRTNAPDKAIGHRDHKSTECPGQDRYNWIKAGMPGVTPSEGPNDPDPGSLPMLQRGSRGDYVKVLQNVLRTKAGQDIEVDGYFGWATRAAVINVQRYFNLSPASGIVGARTWAVVQGLSHS